MICVFSMSKERVFSSVTLKVNLNRGSTGFLHDGWIEHLLLWWLLTYRIAMLFLKETLLRHRASWVRQGEQASESLEWQREKDENRKAPPQEDHCVLWVLGEKQDLKDPCHTMQRMGGPHTEITDPQPWSWASILLSPGVSEAILLNSWVPG